MKWSTMWTTSFSELWRWKVHLNTRVLIFSQVYQYFLLTFSGVIPMEHRSVRWTNLSLLLLLHPQRRSSHCWASRVWAGVRVCPGGPAMRGCRCYASTGLHRDDTTPLPSPPQPTIGPLVCNPRLTGPDPQRSFVWAIFGCFQKNFKEAMSFWIKVDLLLKRTLMMK